jgi:spermidine/putrescine transport system ATP-binding protein
VTFIYITHDQGEALAMSDRVGVMSQGKLQQVANPRDIYNNPANGFVASFVGENNIFTGEVQGTEGNLARFATASGTFTARLGPAVTQGMKARLFLRPEHVRLAPGAGGANSIPVEVTDVAFEGNFISIHARDAGGQVLVAEARNDGATAVPAAGDRLHFLFDGQNAVILTGDTAARDIDA